MIAILSLIFVLTLSLVVVRVATVALTLTGMSRQAAQFQARSAWTGTGFTTAESEQVVNHPVRRRIVSILILLRNAGLVTAASTLALPFVGLEDADEGLWRILWLLGGLILLWVVAGSEWLDQRMARVISWALKRYANLDTRDYAGLLHLAGRYAIAELAVQPGDWLSERALRDLRLPDEGVVVLGITKSNGRYVGAPRGSAKVEPGDALLLYGRSEELSALDRRPSGVHGEEQRGEAVEQQLKILREQDNQENTAGR